TYSVEGLISGDSTPSVTGNVSQVNAGTYNTTLVIDSNNYSGTIDTQLVINKARVVAPSLLAASYGDTLGSITLPTSEYGTWSFVDETSTVVGSVGTHTFGIKFTSSNNNYETYETTTSVEVSKKTLTIVIVQSTFNYDEQPHSIIYKVMDGATDVTSNVTVIGNVTRTNVGETSTTLSIEDDNYACEDIDVKLIVNGAAYNPSVLPNGLTATYGDQLSSVTLTNDASNKDGVWSWNQTGTVGNAGTNNFQATFTPNDTNYASSTHTLSIAVAKKAVTITITNNVYDYNGSARAITYSVEGLISGDSTPSVTGNVSQVNAGTYNTTLVIDSNNYSGSLATSLIINKINPTVTWPVYNNTYYEDRLNISKDYTTAPSANTAGTFAYASGVVYGYAQTGSSYTNANYGYASSGAAITSTFVVTFNPTDTTNYNSVSSNVTINISPVAYNGTYYYGTVEKAIADAGTSNNSGTVVYVILGTNPIVKANMTINNGITLSIPYATGTANSATSTSVNVKLTYTITNTLTINDGVVITNNGIIEIGGILSGGTGGSDYAGHSCDSVAFLYLGSNAKINSTGKIYCYGYVDELTYNNGSQVTIESGQLYMPFVLRDFKGGSQTYGLYSKFGSMHSAPFNQFEFINMIPKLRINYSGSLVAWANLYAGDQHNNTAVNMIGSSSDSVIRFTDSTYSYLEAKYDKNVTNGSMTGRINLDIYGGASANSMTLSLKVLGTVNVSTNDIYFPITYKYHINLRQAEGQTATAEFVLNQRYKIMPGGMLRVNEGTKLTASDLIVYSYFDDSAAIMAGNKYPVKDVPGQFIVNGTFIGTNFAGTILTETSSGATVTITGATTITAYEPKTYEGSSITTSIKEWIVVKEQFKLYLFEGSGISANAKTVATGTFYSKNGGWYSTSASIYYDPNGGTLTGGTSEGPCSTGANGYAITDINTTDPTREYYEFVDWYFDLTFTQPAVGGTIFVNTYVYAKWLPINYEVYYKNVYYQSSTDSTGQLFGTFNYETEQALSEPKNGNYVLGGWYTDSECTNRVTNIVGSEMVNLLDSENKLNLYALWYPEGTSSYVINYVPNLTDGINYDYSDLSFYDTYSFIVLNDDWSKAVLQSLSSYDLNPSKPYYFGGWYTSSTFEESTKVTSVTESIFGTSESVTLYGKWVKKYTVNVSLETVTATYYLKPEQSVTLPTAISMGIVFNEVEDKNTYIILRSLVFTCGDNTYVPGDSFTTSADVNVVGEIVETNYYQTTLQAENATINISVTNGYIIISSEDTELRTTHSFANTSSPAKTETVYISEGATVSSTYSYSSSRYKGYQISYADSSGTKVVEKNENGGTSASAFTMNPYTYTIVGSSGNSSAVCIFEDAEILMADGTTKLAKDVLLGDIVLTWSFTEGKYVATPIIFVEKLTNIATIKTTLFFADGTTADFAGGQSYFDVVNRKFISINADNVYDYIGTIIMSYDNGNVGQKQIVDASVEFVFADTYEFITAYEYSFIYDNVLTMEPFMLYELPFEVDENFKYDEESMMRDIEKYGLYTYEEWGHLLTKEQFDMFNGQFIKVAVGKGYYTEEYIIEIITRYITPENMA
ncbi:MAG: InlB B-repeat-containing protein, partial [Bacilli bacterium]|nr:InlB B-repeat-containing protein [Bacilli bacterium]